MALYNYKYMSAADDAETRRQLNLPKLVHGCFYSAYDVYIWSMLGMDKQSFIQHQIDNPKGTRLAIDGRQDIAKVAKLLEIDKIRDSYKEDNQ